ncbi:MAG: hypothetical protein GY796_16630 [Chloroflexi bacterium]|nr:hypothetical protein [Chloroflexota bacterium]
MYSHEYDRTYHPPMPVVEVQISSIEEPETIVTIEALVDSGSDSTFLPEKILRELGAESVREAWVSGIQDIRYQVQMYMIKLAIGQYEFFGTRVVGDQQGRAILGRNVLNQLAVNLNGLANIVEISQ